LHVAEAFVAQVAAQPLRTDRSLEAARDAHAQ
jgi:hypothetical protein